MNDPNPKIVPAGPVTFEQGTARPDTLEGRADTVPVPPGTPGWRVENMKYLADMVWPVVSTTYSLTINDYRIDASSALSRPSTAKGPLAYWATLKKCSRNHELIEFDTMNDHFIHPVLVRPLFQELYGRDFEEGGLMEATHLHADAPITAEKLRPFFPEIETVANLKGRVVRMRENPYLTLLTMPLGLRPLLAGVLRETDAKAFNDREVTDFPNPFSLKDILAYARAVGEIPRMKEYLPLMDKQKENNP